ncbi:MAG: hypothetical protein ACYDGM_11595 [Vulcanimicrobiaceae bacterium]
MSKLPNEYEYTDVLGVILDDAPKSVLAAILALTAIRTALGTPTDGEDPVKRALTRIMTEWNILFERGIVQRRVPDKYRFLIASLDGGERE